MTEKILDKIIKPEYRSKLEDWVNYIKESEVLGLQIIEQIYSSKGNRHVSILLPKEKILYETHQSIMNRKNDISYLWNELGWRKPRRSSAASSSPLPTSSTTATPSPNPRSSTSSSSKLCRRYPPPYPARPRQTHHPHDRLLHRQLAPVQGQGRVPRVRLEVLAFHQGQSRSGQGWRHRNENCLQLAHRPQIVLAFEDGQDMRGSVRLQAQRLGN